MAKKLTRADSPLHVELVNDQIVISIGVRVLKAGVELADFANIYNEAKRDWERSVLVTHPRSFARFFVEELQREREDGATPLDLFIDQVAEKTLEQGPLGVIDPRDRKAVRRG